MRTSTFSRTHSLVAVMFMGLGPIACTQTPPTTPAAAAPAAPAAPASRPAVAPVAGTIAGTWTWNVDAGGTPITHTVVLKQDGEKLTGTFTDTFDNTTVDIKEGKIHAGQVTLKIVRPFQDSSMTLDFDGKLEGNTIKGKMDFTIGDQPTTSDWEAKRVS